MMSEERPDASLFIGLHKLAQQNGDGLVPELYELMSKPSRHAELDDNVVAFPASARTGSPMVPVSGEGKVLSFRR